LVSKLTLILLRLESLRALAASKIFSFFIIFVSFPILNNNIF
jgi:hypothetical protein